MTAGVMAAPMPAAPTRSTASRMSPRGVKMIFKAVGLAAHGRLSRSAARLAWQAVRRRAARLSKAAV